MVPLHEVYQVPTNEPGVTLLARYKPELADLSMLFIVGSACTLPWEPAHDWITCSNGWNLFKPVLASWNWVHLIAFCILPTNVLFFVATSVIVLEWNSHVIGHNIIWQTIFWSEISCQRKIHAASQIFEITPQNHLHRVHYSLRHQVSYVSSSLKHHIWQN